MTQVCVYALYVMRIAFIREILNMSSGKIYVLICKITVRGVIVCRYGVIDYPLPYISIPLAFDSKTHDLAWFSTN